jgi:hypothetical protein
LVTRDLGVGNDDWGLGYEGEKAVGE